MRSGAGTFCPRSRRLDRLPDFLTRLLLPAADLPAVRAAVPEGEFADCPGTAVSSSTRATRIAVRNRIAVPIVYNADSRESAIELLLAFRWYHARQEHRHGAVAIAAPQNLEDNITALLELGYRPLVVVHGIDRLAVDFRDDVAAREVKIIGKAGRLYFRDQHAALPLHTNARRTFRRESFYAQPELGGRGFTLLVAQASRLRRENMCAVFDHRGGFLLRTVAHVGELHFAANRRGRNRIHKVIAAFHLIAIDAGDYVPALQAGLFGGTARFHVHDHHAVGRAQFFQGNGIGAEVFLEADADGAARHASLRNNLVVNADRGGGGQREADPFIAAAAGDDGGVDAHHFPREIDQRAPGIAGIDCRVGLQESLELMPCSADALAILGADDSGGNRRLQTKWAANRQNPVAHLHAVRVAKLGGRQILVGFNLDHRKVGVFIHANDLGGVFRLRIAAQLHLDLGGLLDHVIVGENVAALVHDDPGTEAALGLRRPILAAVKEAVEEILHG